MMLGARYLGTRSTSESLGVDHEYAGIQRIYVINLDRQPDRWRLMSRELGRLTDRSGKPLNAIARRFSAIDARYREWQPSRDVIQPYYSLADQLFVQPTPLLAMDLDAKARRIAMTPQEIAVSLSHFEVWKLIAAGDRSYTLVLEDDVYFRRGFTKALDRIWAGLIARPGEAAFDILYLSYIDAGVKAHRMPVSAELFKPISGLWQLSGYVLSRRGAHKILDALPVRGPVDLWLNHQFKNLEVFAVRTPIIKQRLDCISTNSYSILPVLAEVGVLSRERPHLFRGRALPRPIFALGKPGSGLTALAMALSMLGYRCCSDIAQLPEAEQDNLLRNKRARIFDAYVNIGSLKSYDYIELAKRYRYARFIVATDDNRVLAGSGTGSLGSLTEYNHLVNQDDNWLTRLSPLCDSPSRPRVLVVPANHRDKWELLCGFLGCDYPSHRYPQCEDRDQRKLVGAGHHSESGEPRPPLERLPRDSSPWIVAQKDWHGLSLAEPGDVSPGNSSGDLVIERFETVDRTRWMLRDDTFPSNLAIFRPRNFSIGTDNSALLTMREERTAVREFTSASIASRERYRYGRFVAEVRPSSVPGLITGIFLYRNSPRQEIDIEFLGRDTTKMLVNVYYNPGENGAKLEYGYRGAPVLIPLGFDAAKDFHRYEIEWSANFIRWRVDDRLVHERVEWDPTPVPHLPMQFNVNLWHSRSRQLAARLDRAKLPAQSAIRRIELGPATLPPACVAEARVYEDST
jgi:GR25 family glycosyltransferase involved in LPS biosynthesis